MNSHIEHNGLGSMQQLIEEIIGASATGGLLVGASMIDVSDPTIVGVGGIILSGLAGAIKVLWDRNTKLSLATDVALKKCEDEHASSAAKYEIDRKQAAEQINVLIQQVIQMNGEVGLMKGRIQGFQEATDKTNADARALINQTHPMS